MELAENRQQRPLQIKVIAQKQGLSVKYLEQLMAILKSAGLVQSIRGARGGYILAKTAGQIKLSDCFYALEGTSAITAECVENKNYCSRVADCVIREVWVEVQDAIMNVLKSITLQDLLDKTEDRKSFS